MLYHECYSDYLRNITSQKQKRFEVPAYVGYFVDFDPDPRTPEPSIPRILLLVYAMLTIGVVGLTVVAQLNPTRLGTSNWNAFFIAEPGPVNIPIYMYTYAFFGTCAYIFANVIRDDRMTLRPREVLYRVFAVLPVSAAVYLLQEIIWPGTVFSVATLVGIAFLTGFNIEAALKLLAVFADRLLKAVPGKLQIVPDKVNEEVGASQSRLNEWAARPDNETKPSRAGANTEAEARV